MSRPNQFDMRSAVEAAVKDEQVLQFVGAAAQLKYTQRQAAFARDFGNERYQRLRELAGRIRQDAVNNLDQLLDEFTRNAEQAGVVVHRARDAHHANELCLDIAGNKGCRLCVKSKSMVTEEIGLVPELIAAGIETIETDLGEFIVQLDGDRPSHIVTPMIHKNRASVARAFVRELGVDYTDDPGELTAIARQYMRQKYRQADLGISGANFLLADSGTVVVCTNEGNADLAVNMPQTHIVVTGIEKVIPGTNELAVLLKLLARSATAQPLTVYTSLLTGPRRTTERDGPQEMHVILLDNGRSSIQADPESRELLRCIRCGACLNACPVFRSVGGGHAYGAVYSGPIGAALVPHLNGLEAYHNLPEASSLCGACYEVCPVSIDLPLHLIKHRRHAVDEHLHGWTDRLFYRLWSYVLQHPGMYRCGQAAARWIGRSLADASGGGTARLKLGPIHSSWDRWLTNGFGPVSGWTRHRDLPAPAVQTFRDWWHTSHKPPALAVAESGFAAASLHHVKHRNSESIGRRVPHDLPRTELADLFADRAQAIGCQVHRRKGSDVASLGAILTSLHAESVILQTADESLSQQCAQAISDAGLTILDALNDEQAFGADAGITDVAAAVAETGSLIVRTNDRVGRRAWLVPPVHIAIVRASQIVPDVIDALAQCRLGNDSSATVIITGPSKTADIEGVLITGVHGPGRIHILLLDDTEAG